MKELNMDLKEAFQQTRLFSLQMVKPLQTEDFILQAAMFASPPKWNIAHTSWFFEEMILKNYKSGYTVYHPQFGYLFNSYYNTLGARVQRQNRGHISRPGVEEIIKYRKYVDKHMLELLSSNDLDDKITDLVLLGINHEQQHQELFFTDQKYNFSVNPLFPAYSEKAYCEDINVGSGKFIKMKEGIYEMGYAGDGFCYDNELARHRVFLESYEICDRLVTNGEFLEFIESGGYEDYQYWHDDALAWKDENKITHPMYWHKKDENWFQYTLAGLRKIQPDHILTHITYYEASAFAQWQGLRLPSEFEWEAAADQFEWGKRWEWTESAYMPYPHYKKGEGAVGEYNGKFMVNQKVLRGASVVTSKNHSRKFNGIRLAK